MPLCLICKNSIKNTNIILELNGLDICKKCFNSLPLIFQKKMLFGVECFFMYSYVSPIKELLKDFKIKNDIALSNVFLGPYIDILRIKYKGYIVLCVPSTNKSNKERGYNHVEEIVRCLNLKTIKAFKKTKTYKQSDMKLQDRGKIKDIIKIDKSLIKKKNKYLIVDDIMTSGSSIEACVLKLQEVGVKKIAVLIVANNLRTW